MGWSCHACTYRNINDVSKACITCGTKRPKKQAVKHEVESIDLTQDYKNDASDSKLPAVETKKRTNSEIQQQSQQRTLFGGIVGDNIVKSESKVAGKRAKTETTRSAGQSSTNSEQNALLTLNTYDYSAKSAAYYRTLVLGETYPVRKARCKEVLKDVFQIRKLRNQQPNAVQCALKGKNQIIVMATGGGKSLCYQLPAVVCGGTTIVISPLIALMRDQVSSLQKRGVSAACINSSNTEKENAHILDRLIGRHRNPTKKQMAAATSPVLPPLTLVYVTPESLQTQKFQDILSELHKKKALAGFAIDEAHCLSSWGHDFRPSYRRLDYIANRFPSVPRMALTATATQVVIKDIQKILKLETAECHVGSFDRPNVFYKIHYKDALDAISPGGSLIDLAKFVSKQHKRAKRDEKNCSGILYVHKRDDTTFLAKEITKRTGIPAGAYHGKLKDVERTRVQEDWTTGKIQIAVATIAFGMGIDLAHVRYVVHWAIPKTMDGFYQESGRAGRDGLPAISLVYFSRDDANKFNFLIQKQEESSKNKDRETIEAAVKRKQEALQQVVDYCMTAQCRRQYVLKHFGEKETNPKTVCQGACDFCANPQRVEKAINASDAMRAVGFQRKQASKKKTTAKVWDGQWSKPHGDDGDLYGDGRHEDWEVEGLGITSSRPSTLRGSANLKGVGFVTAKSMTNWDECSKRTCKISHANTTLHEKLSSLEAKEENENSEFFNVGNSTSRIRDPFPEHVKAMLKKIPLAAKVTKKPQQRSSSEIAASADKMRAELAALKAQTQALKNSGTAKTGAGTTAPPPPPPPPTFATIRKR